MVSYAAFVVHPNEDEGVHVVYLDEVELSTQSEIDGQVSKCGQVAKWRDIFNNLGGLSFYLVPIEQLCKDCFPR